MRVQPSKARYFAVGKADAWREAHRLSLVETQPAGEARVELRNPPHGGAEVPPLLELVGRLKLTIFSLPQNVERVLGEAAIHRALEVCALHKHRLAPMTRLRREALIVYFDGQHSLRLVERTARYQERKHRSTSKFSTAFKPRKSKVEERQVATYEL